MRPSGLEWTREEKKERYMEKKEIGARIGACQSKGFQVYQRFYLVFNQM